ncbi:DUF3054 domain-containing protein [Gryllotalpicola sp.]|uniref:DUF3054 domain-containing protein n=1 Tax=Gryllotalpicola sp. TaxID=1932787 RepID=UPI00262CDE25|nr:DUF3054 domain-containing protein [Gryllotalpicola sp.]
MKDPQRYLALAVILDFVLVILFAVIGRTSHREDLGVAGVVQTAWPFLVGTVVGWLATVGWRGPLSIVRTGLGVWAATVVIGMLLRLASGQGIAAAFVIVAAVTLAVFLLGWRAVALLIVRRRA